MRLVKCEIYTPKQHFKEMGEVINAYSLQYLIEDVQLNPLEIEEITRYFK